VVGHATMRQPKNLPHPKFPNCQRSKIKREERPHKTTTTKHGHPKTAPVCAVALGMAGTSAYILNRIHSSRNVPLIDTQNAKKHPQHEVSTPKSPPTAFRNNPPIHHDKQTHQQQRLDRSFKTSQFHIA
jgi:hypothetical protein